MKSLKAVLRLGCALAVGPALAVCVTSGTSFQSTAFPSKSGTFYVDYTATPNGPAVDALTMLSLGAPGSMTKGAVIVRFSNTGLIDARDGSTYNSAAGLPYLQGKSYGFHIVVNVSSHTYTVDVKLPSGQTVPLNIAGPFKFRTEQQQVSALDHWAVTALSGSHTVCNVTISAPPVVGNCDPCAHVYPADCTGSDCMTLDTSPSMCASYPAGKVGGVVLLTRPSGTTAWTKSATIPIIKKKKPNGKDLCIMRGLYEPPVLPADCDGVQSHSIPLTRWLTLQSGTMYDVAIMAMNSSGQYQTPPTAYCEADAGACGEGVAPACIAKICWPYVWQVGAGALPNEQCW